MTEPNVPVLLDVGERIATITLNRPEARNALSSEVLRLLPRLMHEADTDDDVDVDHPDRRRPGVLRRARPQGARLDGGNLGGGSGADGGRNSPASAARSRSSPSR